MQSQQIFSYSNVKQNNNGFGIAFDCNPFLFCQNFYECVLVDFDIAKLLHFLFTLSLVF